MNSCDRQRFNDFLRSAVWGLKDRKKKFFEELFEENFNRFMLRHMLPMYFLEILHATIAKYFQSITGNAS